MYIYWLSLLILSGLSTVLARPVQQETTPVGSRREDHVFASKQIGEPHGKLFSDAEYINRPGLEDHRRIAEMFFRGCGKGQHFNQFSVGYRDNSLINNPWVYSIHGGHTGNNFAKLVLALNEYITEVHLYTYHARVKKIWPFVTHRTRIGRIVVFTNLGQVVSCGSAGPKDELNILAPSRSALLYFSGSSGTAIDALTGHFIPTVDF